jgi:hypothetical protein
LKPPKKTALLRDASSLVHDALPERLALDGSATSV